MINPMAFEILFLILFWGAVIGLLHTYFLYPLLLHLWTSIVSTEENTGSVDLLSVALIIAAYNEEEIIAEKIQNSLQLDYPEELLNIIVFSDASDDLTDEIVEEYEELGVSLVRIEGRVGKTECQNRVAAQVDEDILVFSDANSMYDQDAIKELVSGFSPQVGCVVGELRYRDDSDVKGESVYWRYESWIKRLESRFHSLVTGNGAIYAVKSSSYVPQPPDRISDFTEPLSIIQNGELVKYAPNAVAREETSGSTSQELQRRVRIVTRSWNSVVTYPDLLNPIRNPRFAYQLWSHKLIRWLSPVLLVLAFTANVGLVFSSGKLFYQLTMTAQVLFYLFAIIGSLVDKYDIGTPAIVHVPFYFVQANYGMFRGLLNFLRGSNIVVWETTSREGG